ncbi:DUF6348 family protein [Myceligenerans salitolerans]|uniref:Uncharacterized protein n=1 Tax=Myceligenerans salitolerans TaxID=1230528 RepID=A0ABS3IEA6_9MICO|nr:DUF6348 family protein [Myceligenerans salitolerans]MBO0611319.1 hypothetical protein [Myceligenerans salitolerans]
MTNNPGISLAAKTELLATALHESRGGGWTITEPGFVRGPGSTAVAIQPDDSGTPSHLDLEFILNVDRREETSVVDCVTGVAKDPFDAVRHAIFQWLQTTGAAVFELFEQQGEIAGHFSHDDPLGVPGWHTIGGNALGWGYGATDHAVRDWMVANPPWVPIAEDLKSGLDREQFNGIKLYIASSETFTTAEVRINGQIHEPSSQALAVLDWPRTVDLSVGRTYLLLLHGDTTTS